MKNIRVEKRKHDYLAYLLGTNRSVWQSGATANEARSKLETSLRAQAVERQPTPPKPCVIVNCATGERIAYDHEGKSILFFHPPTIFPNKKDARTALYHICKNLPARKSEDEPDRYVIQVIA